MPIKRRKQKARLRIDEFMIEDLMYGPGTCLLGGCGYLGERGDGLWRDKPANVKALVLAAMKADWQRQAAAVWAAWHNRTPHELEIAASYHGDPTKPWAQNEFGEPA